jgi:hypothetical protein
MLKFYNIQSLICIKNYNIVILKLSDSEQFEVNGCSYLKSARKMHTNMSQLLLLLQPNTHNMLNTYIYHQLPATCFGVCYTTFRETIGLLAQKL